MRQGKNSRGRNRTRRPGNGIINRNTTLDSNGPDVRLRGNAYQLYEKYVSLGNDAAAAGERISAEAYYQHADHYFRVNSAILAAGEERRAAHNGGHAPGNGNAQNNPNNPNNPQANPQGHPAQNNPAPAESKPAETKPAEADTKNPPAAPAPESAS